MHWMIYYTVYTVCLYISEILWRFGLVKITKLISNSSIHSDFLLFSRLATRGLAEANTFSAPTAGQSKDKLVYKYVYPIFL